MKAVKGTTLYVLALFKRNQVLAVVLAVVHVVSVTGTWSFMNFSGGGWFTGVFVHPSGRLYGRTDVGKFDEYFG